MVPRLPMKPSPKAQHAESGLRVALGPNAEVPAVRASCPRMCEGKAQAPRRQQGRPATPSLDKSHVGLQSQDPNPGLSAAKSRASASWPGGEKGQQAAERHAACALRPGTARLRPGKLSRAHLSCQKAGTTLQGACK